MKKFLFYINAIHHGGAERVIVNLANKFSSKNYEVVLVTSFYDKEEYTLNSKVKRLSLEDKEINASFFKRNFNRTLKLREICKSEKPDIVVSFMAEANFRSIIATMFLGIKTLISVRNDPNKEYPNVLFRFMAKILYPFASGCVFQTEDAKRWFSKKVQRKSKIIMNQVDDEFYQINYNGERKNIVAVGRLEPQKNHKLLIKAFSMIANDFPEEKLIIYGGGSLYNELVKYVDGLGLTARVIFKGPTLNIQNKIYNSKLFILSSNYEGLPNVIMEAMALGVPIISTDCPCGGPRMLIENNKSGVLVKPNDVQDLAYAMKLILSDTCLADYLSKNAKKASKKFESNNVYNTWESYILQITSYN